MSNEPRAAREGGATYSVTIKDLPQDERPRERLALHGPQSLPTGDLLAIIVRTGVKGLSATALGEKILADLGGLAGISRASVTQLARLHGMGEAKAAQVAAAVELAKRVAANPAADRDELGSPQHVAQLLMPEMRYLDREEFRVLHLDTKNRLCGMQRISIGTLNSSVVHPREVFRAAVEGTAAAVIAVHNHPSGDPEPSQEDRVVTGRLAEAGRVLGIELIDHVILGDNRWVSMKQRGMI